jgi:hypothetical protein
MAIREFWIKRCWIKRFISVSFQLRGSTLIESLTALAIVTTVMGAAFTLYNQTIANQAQVLKTRAAYIQNQFEQNPFSEEDLSNDFLTVTTQIENYQNIPDVKHITLTIANKQGKKIFEKQYLKYVSTNP